MTAAKAGFSRRVITASLFGSERRFGQTKGLQPGGIRCYEGRSHGDAYSIQEIATGDLVPHAQFMISIFALHLHSSPKFTA